MLPDSDVERIELSSPPSRERKITDFISNYLEITQNKSNSTRIIAIFQIIYVINSLNNIQKVEPSNIYLIYFFFDLEDIFALRKMIEKWRDQ